MLLGKSGSTSTGQDGSAVCLLLMYIVKFPGSWQYRESIGEAIRRAAEMCDSLQSFFLLHSLGGGTGSGLGSYIMTLLHDDYPEVCSGTRSWIG